MDLENRLEIQEAEIKVLRDTVYILTTRIYNLETFIHQRYGIGILCPKSIIRTANQSYAQVAQLPHPSSSESIHNSRRKGNVGSSSATSTSSELEPGDSMSYEHSSTESQSHGITTPYLTSKRHILNPKSTTAYGGAAAAQMTQSQSQGQQRHYRDHPYNAYNRVSHYRHQNLSSTYNEGTSIRYVKTPDSLSSISMPHSLRMTLNQNPRDRNKNTSSLDQEGARLETNARTVDRQSSSPHLQLQIDESRRSVSREGCGGESNPEECAAANDLRRRGIILKIDRKTPTEDETSGSSSSYHTVSGLVHHDPDEEDPDRVSFQTMSKYAMSHTNHPECPTCRATLDQDERTRSKQTGRFQCTFCVKVFLEEREYEAHKELHSAMFQEKKFLCEFCEKRFKRAQELQVHRRIHTGEKPYKCPICSKCFSQSSSVQLHLPVHTGEKPFSCPVCQKTFSRLSHMKKHCKNLHEHVP